MAAQELAKAKDPHGLAAESEGRACMTERAVWDLIPHRIGSRKKKLTS